ncbi:MAG: hypothetical protein WBA43_06305 [Elainellaceae cyanobacterium]
MKRWHWRSLSLSHRAPQNPELYEMIWMTGAAPAKTYSGQPNC